MIKLGAISLIRGFIPSIDFLKMLMNVSTSFLDMGVDNAVNILVAVDIPLFSRVMYRG